MKDLPARKYMRLKDYDYSQNGAYFITLCVNDRRPLLGKIAVGDGVLDVPFVQLSECGAIVNKYINNINTIRTDIEIDKYVIMPNHIHMIIAVHGNGTVHNNIAVAGHNGTSRTPSPTNAAIPSIVSTLKRFVNKEIGFSLWQRAYHDRIIRNESEYRNIWQYIDENPARWTNDTYYVL